MRLVALFLLAFCYHVPAPAAYTAAQAERGAVVYKAACIACHGADLKSPIAPVLAGPNFAQRWSGRRSLLDLFAAVRAMPPGGAGDLTTAQQVDVMAYILQQNGYAPGARPLSGDAAVLQKSRVEISGGAVAAGKPAPEFVKGTGSAAPGAGPTQDELTNAHRATRDWLYHTHNYAGTRYVALDQINASNAGSLRAACAFQFGETTNFQTGPIVYDGVMYLTGLYNTVAIDAATCRPKWRHTWQPLAPTVWPTNRGVAIQQGRLVRGTSDGYLVQLSAATGELIWARKVADALAGETFTMPPLIFEDLILIGPAGSENGISGWVGAFRMSDGSPVWRFKTVPGAREGTGTWPNPGKIVLGGGSVWTPFSLDAAKGELYVAVSNPAPDLPAHMRPGENLYTNSLVALDVRTGALRWYKQMVPNDSHDWDLTQVSPLFTARIAGREASMIATVGKDGYLRTVDRNSREVIHKTPVTTIENWDVPVTSKGVKACPGVLGGVEWSGPAFHPGANLLYTVAVDWCSFFTADEKWESREPGKGSFFGGRSRWASQAQGWLTATDASTGEVRWKYKSPRPMVGAVTATAGDVVFTGELTGDFVAFHAGTGKELFRFHTGGPIGGGLVTYQVQGKQYVAVAAGSPSRFWVDKHPGSPTVFVFALP
ncbi:MAG: PQQ-binding-like beta-propeller repeat protein [Bryobacteraceae bacterium]|nr:PQQ-binding-like beta-propeller repeat protein [Bryobacteraceae bacterium]